MFKYKFNAKTRTRVSVLYSFALLLSLFIYFSSIPVNKTNAGKNTHSYTHILNEKIDNGSPAQSLDNIMDFKYEPYLFTENIKVYNDIIDYKYNLETEIKTNQRINTLIKL